MKKNVRLSPSLCGTKDSARVAADFDKMIFRSLRTPVCPFLYTYLLSTIIRGTPRILIDRTSRIGIHPEESKGYIHVIRVTEKP